MKKIDKILLDKMCADAASSNRLRISYNLHDELSDLIQRFITVSHPGTYIQPHKHENPDKREIFVLMQGRVIVVTFNNDGSILDYIILSIIDNNYIAEIPPTTWHSIIVLEQNSIVFQVIDGPFIPIDNKNFASWAPSEGGKDCDSYINTILKNIPELY